MRLRPLICALVMLLLIVGAEAEEARAASDPAAGDGSGVLARAWKGQLLGDALRDLRDLGLDLFFTSNMVSSKLRVSVEPTSSDPVEILTQILAPHGLAIVPGPGGRWVVIQGEPELAGIRGSVLESESGGAVPGVRMIITSTGRETWSQGDGAFEFLDIPAGVHTLEAHLPGFVVYRETFDLEVGQVSDVRIELEAAPLEVDEILVTPSSVSLLRDDPVAGLALDRDDIFALPHLSDDIFRALTLLPGVTGEEVSARFSVRGGRSDEVLVLLDDVELYEPYHMKDYSSSLSIIAPRSLREVNLITGSFPAQYGDRMSGVLEMRTVRPDRKTHHVGLGLLVAEIGSSGSTANDRATWYGSARRGSPELALDFLGRREKPRYWDAFGKLQYQIGDGNSLGLHLLHSDDSLDYDQIDPDTTEDYLTSYGNSYGWLTHQAILGPRLFVDSAIYAGRVDRNRTGNELEILLDPDSLDMDMGSEGEEEDSESDAEDAADPDAIPGFTIRDQRSLDVLGVKQSWSFQASDRQFLAWGFEGRSLETRYDYFNTRLLEDPLAELRSQPRTGLTRFQARLEGEQYNAFVSDRLRPTEKLTVELGLRYDRATVTRDSDISPRMNLVYSPGPSTVFRMAWGYFYQSQRPYELQVEDGVTELETAERTEQRLLGFERQMTTKNGRNWLLRLEAYQRRISNPRARYENLYEPITVFPEIEPDRVLFQPDSSETYGFEVFVRGSAGRFDWFGSYAYSRALDSIDGRWQARGIDQPHAVNLDLNYRAGNHWNINLAWKYHSGWPTTAVSGRAVEDDEGEVEILAVFGPINGDRLPEYHRLDLRLSREWQRPRGVLGFFLEIQNVYDRRNVAGYDVDFEFEILPDGTIDLLEVVEPWGGFLPSFGITWDF